MAVRRKPPGKGLLERSNDVALFGLCTDAQVLETLAVSVSTTEVRTALVQQVFQQSKSLGGQNVDPSDGSGLIHLIWGCEYNFVLDVGNAVLTNPAYKLEAEAWLSRDRDSGVGIAKLNPVPAALVPADEQDFAKVIHGTVLNDNMRLIAGTGAATEIHNTNKNFWFNVPYVAINPYYLDGRVDAIAAVALTFGYRLTAYVYYQLKRVDRRVYNYLMEKYSTGTGGMKSRAREIKVSGEV